MAGIGVIVNPRAAGNRARPGLAARLASVVGADGEVLETADLQALDAALARLKDRGIDALAVCGGDGTLCHTISRAVAVWAAMPFKFKLNK